APVSARRRVDRAPPEESADLEGARESARLAQKLIAETCARQASPPAPSPSMPDAAPQGRAPDYRRYTLRVLGYLLAILSKRRERGEDTQMRLMQPPELRPHLLELGDERRHRAQHAPRRRDPTMGRELPPLYLETVTRELQCPAAHSMPNSRSFA